MKYALVDVPVLPPLPIKVRSALDGEHFVSLAFGVSAVVWSGGPSALEAVANVYEKAAALWERRDAALDAFRAAVDGRSSAAVHGLALAAWSDGLRHPLLSQLGVPDDMMAMPPR